MKLFLASEDENETTIEALRTYLNGFKGKKCYFIPTAINGELDLGDSWQSFDIWKIVQDTGMEVFPFLLENHREGVKLEDFTGVDVLWFTGGSAGYLIYWVRRTGLDQILPKLLDKYVYIGSSSGSWIASKSLDIAEWFIGEGEKGAANMDGLGLIDFDIYPHYDDSLYDQIKQKYKGNKLYLLKDGEHVVVENSVITLFGEERIITNEN